MAGFKRIIVVLILTVTALLASSCAGCNGATSFLRVATDSIQNDPMAVNVVHAEEQVCVAHSG